MKRTGFLLKETLNKSHFLKIRHSGESRNPVETIVYWMPVKLQTIHGLHPAGVLRTTRFVPDESVTGMTVKTLLQRFLKTVIGILALLFCSLVSADVITIKFAYVGDTGNSAYLGAQQGLSEATLQGQFLNQQYELDTVTIAKALTTDYSPYLAVIAAVDHDTYRKLLDKLPNVPVFNITLEDDDLRTACLPSALHIVASKQMKQDAIAQWQKKNPKAQVTAQTWHHEFIKFAGRDLNKRFSKNYKRPMDDPAWAGWAAVKMSSDTVARENITDPAKLLNYLKTTLLFDGQMGIEMNFRPTGQLRQPLLIIENGKIAGEAPVKGVANPTDLDSLGNVACAK